MAARKDDPELIDLTGFTDREESMRRASAGVGRYHEIARHYLVDATAATIAHHAFMGIISRARGLHEGTVREIRNANPHAVRPLMRGMLELAALVLYVNLNPDYILTVVGVGDARHKRKSYEAMFHAVRDTAPGKSAAIRSCRTSRTSAPSASPTRCRSSARRTAPSPGPTPRTGAASASSTLRAPRPKS